MSQASISSYYHSRKRGIEDDIVANKNKVIRLEEFDTNTDSNSSESSVISSGEREQATGRKLKKDVLSKVAQRQILTPQRSTRSTRAKQMQNVDGLEMPKLVNFVVGGSLSPQKKSKQPPAETVTRQDDAESCGGVIIAKQPGMSTPVKVQQETSAPTEKPQTRKPLNVDEIKAKLKNSSRITELNTQLNKLKSGLDRIENIRNEREGKGPVKEKKDDDVTPKQLKPFKSIEFQILSPTKRLTSPLKLKDSPMKNTFLSSPKAIAPKRLFSPMKCPLEMSPVKAPAYQRFQNLAEKSSSQLQLPFKYRYLLDIFKAVDAVTAMFFNRKEKITFKKLKPAVQRILRKNFHESHLSQIQKLMPDAYKFAQEKTRNFGSTSKQDYYQLVITPNISSSSSDSDLKELTLSPQLLIERGAKLTRILTDLVFDEHHKFLQTLEVPMSVTRGALKRWHPEFDLESVSEIPQGNIPAPPNVEKYSSARDILNTARNLFNCGTPMDRALERLEEKKKADRAKLDEGQQKQPTEPSTGPPSTPSDEPKPKQETAAAKNLLKGVPQSLLEKIRAKQAAKALDTMTRRPSVEREAAKYGRLPEVARHARNVYITEKKGVMPLENVLRKIENSYRGTTSMKEIEELLRIIAKEMPVWLSFHEIRNAMYVKLNRDSDFSLIVAKLEKLADDKKNAK